MRIYVAGPMTGMPHHNRPAFYDAAGRLIDAGHEPINPAAIPDTDGWQYADYLRAALKLMLDTEAVALLPGWRRSRGARIEYQLARSLGMPCKTVPVWLSKARRTAPTEVTA